MGELVGMIRDLIPDSLEVICLSDSEPLSPRADSSIKTPYTVAKIYRVGLWEVKRDDNAVRYKAFPKIYSWMI